MSFDIRDHKLPLPDGWSYKRIGDVALVNADTIKKKDAPDEIYYIDISSVSNGAFEPPKHMPYSDAPSRAKRRVKNNDFIISTVRPNLKQYVFLDEVHENWVASTGFAVVSAMEPGTEWYLYSVITSNLFNEHLVRVADGGAYPAFNPKEIEDAVIHWPDSQTLELIDNLANHLNTKQKVNSQTNQTLEQIAQALFKSWFVDFDPVKEKIAVLEAGGTAEEAELAAMSTIAAKSSEQLAELKQSKPDAYEQLAQTAALFPSAMQESELGEIPEGWRVSTIGEEVHISGGGTPSTKNKDFWENGSIHWTTPKDLSNLRDKVLADTERKITEAGLEKISSGLLPVDTVLMSSRAPVGYLALAKVPVAINQGYIAMRCEKLLSPEFTLQWAVSNMDEIKQRASGTTFAEISKKNFRPISVVVPTEGIIKKYSDQAQSLYEKIYAAVEETRALSSIRDTLLPQLLSGNKSLKEHIA